MTGDPPAAQASTPRRGRLTKAAEFDAVTQLGRSVGGRYLTLRYRAAEGGSQARIGYAVPRKVGGAVDRNLVKRRLREAIAHHEQLLATYEQLHADLSQATDAPRGPISTLEAGIRHERGMVAYWRELLRGA